MAAAAAKSLQSCPTLCDPITAAHQASLSLGFSRQEHWSGLPFPSPVHESEKWKWSRSIVTLATPWTAGVLPGSSVHGILQAKVPEWGAIAFSEFFTLKQLYGGSGYHFGQLRCKVWLYLFGFIFCSVNTSALLWPLPGSSVHGVSQARVLELGAIAFSVSWDEEGWKLSWFGGWRQIRRSISDLLNLRCQAGIWTRAVNF